VHSHVFSSEGCRLAAFCCPATVDGVHAVYCEECSRTVSSAVAASSARGARLVEQKPKRTPRRMILGSQGILTFCVFYTGRFGRRSGSDGLRSYIDDGKRGQPERQ